MQVSFEFRISRKSMSSDFHEIFVNFEFREKFVNFEFQVKIVNFEDFFVFFHFDEFQIFFLHFRFCGDVHGSLSDNAGELIT